MTTNVTPLHRAEAAEEARDRIELADLRRPTADLNHLLRKLRFMQRHKDAADLVLPALIREAEIGRLTVDPSK